MGEMKSIALVKQAKSCGMHEMGLNACKGHSQKSNSEDKGCCDDRSVFIKGQEGLKESPNIVLQDLHFDLAYLKVAGDRYFSSFVDTHFFKQYKQPLSWRDLPILHQTFLI